MITVYCFLKIAVMKKLLFYFTSIVLIIFFESIFPVQHCGTMLGIFFIIFIGLYNGSYAGCGVGFFIGIIDGVFSATTLGVCSFSYSIVGYLAGRLPKRIDENKPVTQIVVVLLGETISKAINLIIEVLFTGTYGIPSFGWHIITTILTPLFFLVFKKWWLLWFGRLDVER